MKGFTLRKPKTPNLHVLETQIFYFFIFTKRSEPTPPKIKFWNSRWTWEDKSEFSKLFSDLERGFFQSDEEGFFFLKCGVCEGFMGS